MHIDDYKDRLKAQIDLWASKYKEESETDEVNWPVDREVGEWLYDFLDWYDTK